MVMKSLFTPVCGLLLCALVLDGCQKVRFPYPHPTGCQITGLKGEILGEDSVMISYNGKGNPISMTRTRVGTGAPNYFFRYDKRDRLTDIIGAYSDNATFETWHHYEYNDGNYSYLPRTDSVYLFGIIGNGPLPDSVFFGVRASDFTFDIYGRIIKVIETDVRPYPAVYTDLYYYNPQGNLVATSLTGTGGVDSVTYTSYDTHTNPHRMHPIWQLIDRDYSINNRQAAVAYNSFGLPTIIGGKGSSGIFLGYYFSGELEIDYTCGAERF
ncbi:hypothetical protein DCC81_10040 [Chitinophaga parva]|uniref:DUF4595 domain-containing protein n=2 Tax=Chitinophaga parva TaxID=2169414 RepID=A0A2T7BQ04_9BACT|nr:hypothetical protein DCC81_10040 [Chitinophaga parva]